MSLPSGNSEFPVFVMAPVLTLFGQVKLLEKAMKSQIFWTTHVHVY